jgi:energy-coupling factor transport system ATP-binding protein
VVAEDVAFALENMGLTPETIQIRVEEALRWVDLYERAAHFSHHLSGGEQQRLILAGALAQQKGCLLLDDPLCMVAGRSRAEILNLLKEIQARESCTMVHSTHLLEEALLAERLVALDNGVLVFDGSPGRLLQEKELVNQLGLEVPAIADLGEMLARRGLVEPDEVVTLEHLLELLTAPGPKKDNKKVEI